jgi:hypothetical protein
MDQLKCHRLKFIFTCFIIVVSLVGYGCSKAFRLEYGKVNAQFEAIDIAREGKPFLNKKVTVKGTITNRSLNQLTGEITMVLNNEVQCIWYGSHRDENDILLKVEDYQVEKVAAFDGFLVRCEPGSVILNPVMGRSKDAPFHPLKNSL